MGRAIVRQPQAFLMDEPLSNLDAKLRVEMRAEIARIQRDLNVTTVYVTHDQTEAMTMGDRVAVMRNGLLQQVDKPQVLYERPRNLFVAEFIGSPAMNVVMADLARTDGDLWVSFGGQRLRLDPSSLERRPALSSFEGRQVILGIRPEDMEDAALVGETSDDRRLSVVCDIREDMGSEVYVHFNVPAKRSRRRRWSRPSSSMLPRTRRHGWLRSAPAAKACSFVARLERRHAAREREPLELDVDVARLHFFDPETGLGIDDDDQRLPRPRSGSFLGTGRRARPPPRADRPPVRSRDRARRPVVGVERRARDLVLGPDPRLVGDDRRAPVREAGDVDRGDGLAAALACTGLRSRSTTSSTRC